MMRFKDIFRGGAILAGVAMSMAASAQIGVTVDGDPVQFAAARPQMIQGRVMVPLRGVMEKIGAFVDWDAVQRRVTAQKGNVDLSLRIGDRFATVNGRTVTLDVPAQIISGSTMVPLRFMGESLGADVRWDDQTMTVAITTSGGGTGTGGTGTGGTGTGGTGTGGTGTGGTGTGGVGSTNVAINSFTHSANGWVRSGDSIRFDLEGTPGGTATLQIPGLSREITMNEVNPGQYRADWVPRDPQGNAISLSNATVIARLKVGNNERLIQAGNKISVDTQAPDLRNMEPENNTQVQTSRPTITAVFDDMAGSGVDRTRTRVTVNNRDVTANATITDNFFAYTPTTDLPAGTNTVSVTVVDKAGNTTTKGWTFRLTANAEVVKAFVVSPSGRVKVGQTLQFRITTTPKSDVRLTVGNRIVNAKMNETAPGNFRYTYEVRPGDVFNDERVTATITLPDGNKVNVESPVRIGGTTTQPEDAAAPVKPTISSPTDGERVSGNIVVRGKAAPNSRVLVKVDYATSVLGALRVTGTLAEVTVETDAQGNFTTKEISPDTLVKGSNTEYTITATNIAADGKRSESTVRKAKG